MAEAKAWLVPKRGSREFTRRNRSSGPPWLLVLWGGGCIVNIMAFYRSWFGWLKATLISEVVPRLNDSLGLMAVLLFGVGLKLSNHQNLAAKLETSKACEENSNLVVIQQPWRRHLPSMLTSSSWWVSSLVTLVCLLGSQRIWRSWPG